MSPKKIEEINNCNAKRMFREKGDEMKCDSFIEITMKKVPQKINRHEFLKNVYDNINKKT